MIETRCHGKHQPVLEGAPSNPDSNDASQRNADGSPSSMISSDQNFILNEVSNIGPGPATVIDESNEVSAMYATERPAGGSTTITEDQTTQTYKLHMPPGNCWNRTITAVS